MELDWDVRQKSRFDATDSLGRTLGVFLPRGSVVRGGDVLVAEDGSLVRVIAAPQPVLVVAPAPSTARRSTCCAPPTTSATATCRSSCKPDHLKLEPDHVLADMLRSMHLIVSEEQAPFEPEGGAYARPACRPRHGHDHAAVTAHDARRPSARRMGTHARRLQPRPLTAHAAARAARAATLLQLMWLASPALPVGGFSYSEGLEAAVEAGLRARRGDGRATGCSTSCTWAWRAADLPSWPQACRPGSSDDHARASHALNAWV